MDPLLALTVAWSLAVPFCRVHRAQDLRARGMAGRRAQLPAAGRGAYGARLRRAPDRRRAHGCRAPLACDSPDRSLRGSRVQLIVFAAAMAINLRRGALEHRLRLLSIAAPPVRDSSGWMVARNLACSHSLALGLLLPSRPRELTALDIVTVVAVVATLSFLYPVIAVALQPPPATFAENFEASSAARQAQ